MSAWFTLQYTLTETHVGASGVLGATDLPIAREATTQVPFLPDTSLKGVARDAAERLWPPRSKDVPSKEVHRLFGGVPGRGSTDTEGVGALSFTQGHLLLYPFRSLERPYVYATCALLLIRWVRLARAYGLDVPDEAKWASLRTDHPEVRIADEALGKGHLTVEGMAFGIKDLRPDPASVALAGVLAGMFRTSGTGEDPRRETGDLVRTGLVVLPDAEFFALVKSAPPVHARIKLNHNKTTTGDGGNLWYEEMLPPDCLFWSILSLRGGTPDTAATPGKDLAPLGKNLVSELASVQIGAGESTGHGRVWWWAPSPDVSGGKTP